MRKSLLLFTALAAAALVAGSAGAQNSNGTSASATNAQRAAAGKRHEAARERIRNLPPDERKAAIEKAKDRRETRRANMTDAQKAWLGSYEAEAKSTHAAVKSGSLSKAAGEAQLDSWRAAHPRPKQTR